MDSTAQATYEHLKTVANEDIVRDVQTKIMHDNAFDQFVSHLQGKSLIREADIQIGNFISIEDSFYIFDISFYQSLFSEKGFVGLLEEIQKQNTQKEAEQQFGELTREQRRNKDVKGKIAEIVEESNAKNLSFVKTSIDSPYLPFKFKSPTIKKSDSPLTFSS